MLEEYAGAGIMFLMAMGIACGMVVMTTFLGPKREFAATVFFHGDGLVITKVMAIYHRRSVMLFYAFNDFFFRHNFNYVAG